MKAHRILAAALVATTALGGACMTTMIVPAVAADSAQQTAVDHDAGKLSKDGAQAFRDMHLTRIAIFDADPTQAKDLIGKAQTAFGKAKTDYTSFMKAEADLKAPADVAAKPADPNAKPGDAKATPPASTQKIAWLPVDGQLTLGEDFQATPEKTAAVSDANKSIARGDKNGAMEKLKLAGVNVNFVMAVLPLDKTTADVDQAANLIGQGKYYEANAVLKQAEDGMRFDVVDAVGVPQKTNAANKTDAGKTDAGKTGAPASAPASTKSTH